MKKEITILSISLLLVLLFAYAGAVKLADFQTFSVQLSKSPLISDYSRSIAWLLPVLELIIAALLITDRMRMFALYSSFFLMLTFTIYLIYLLNYSYYIPCSCGGILGDLSWNAHIIFNLFFVTISAAGVLMINKKTSPS